MEADGWEKTPYKKKNKGRKKYSIEYREIKSDGSTPTKWKEYKKYKTKKIAKQAVKALNQCSRGLFRGRAEFRFIDSE